MKGSAMRFAKTIILLAVSLVASGCSLLEYKPLGKETLKNASGHVIGYRERLCDCKAGEELDRVVLFTPHYTEAGTVIGYDPNEDKKNYFVSSSGLTVVTRDYSLYENPVSPEFLQQGNGV